MAETIRVKGLRQLLRATDRADKNTKKMVRDGLRKAAEPVRVEAMLRFAKYDPKSAARYGISVRRVGTIAVEQRLRRTTGNHPEFGRLQMRKALIPSLEDNQDQVVAAIDDELERWTIEWGVGG